MADELGRGLVHGGFWRWITVRPGESCRFRFFYRADDISVTASNLGLIWDDQAGDSRAFSHDLVGTEGQQHHFYQVLHSPVDSPTQLYIGLRQLGSGTVWSADMTSLEAGGVADAAYSLH